MNTRSIILSALAGIALAGLPTSVMAQPSASQAGVAAAVRGSVVLVAALPAATREAIGQDISSGDRIFLGDRIETGSGSGLQIMLLDETIFTIGPDAAMVIDEFVYDPQSSAGKVSASVLKGAFRFVSGQVAKEEPRKMNVSLPVGTIGIRGTSAAGRVNPPATPDGVPTADVVLLGPGADNNADERIGRITVSNGAGSVDITRSGYGTRIGGPNIAPQFPTRFDPNFVASLTGNLGTDASSRQEQAGADGDGGQGGQQGGQSQPSGQQQAGQQPSGGTGGSGPSGPGPLTGFNANQAGNLTGQNFGSGVVTAAFVGRTGQNTTQRQQQIMDAVEQQNSGQTSVTTFDQLRSIQTGTANFSFGTVPMAIVGTGAPGDGGTYQANLQIDYGARTLHLQVTNVNYQIAGTGGGSFVFNDGATGTFTNDTGPVSDSWTSTANPGKFASAPTVGVVTVTGEVRNNLETGKIADTARVGVQVQHDGVTIAGSKTVAGSSVPPPQ